jgi:hypothetical protein
MRPPESGKCTGFPDAGKAKPAHMAPAGALYDRVIAHNMSFGGKQLESET